MNKDKMLDDLFSSAKEEKSLLNDSEIISLLEESNVPIVKTYFGVKKMNLIYYTAAAVVLGYFGFVNIFEQEANTKLNKPVIQQIKEFPQASMNLEEQTGKSITTEEIKERNKVEKSNNTNNDLVKFENKKVENYTLEAKRKKIELASNEFKNNAENLGKEKPSKLIDYMATNVINLNKEELKNLGCRVDDNRIAFTAFIEGEKETIITLQKNDYNVNTNKEVVINSISPKFVSNKNGKRVISLFDDGNTLAFQTEKSSENSTNTRTVINYGDGKKIRVEKMLAFNNEKEVINSKNNIQSKDVDNSILNAISYDYDLEESEIELSNSLDNSGTLSEDNRKIVFSNVEFVKRNEDSVSKKYNVNFKLNINDKNIPDDSVKQMVSLSQDLIDNIVKSHYKLDRNNKLNWSSKSLTEKFIYPTFENKKGEIQILTPSCITNIDTINKELEVDKLLLQKNMALLKSNLEKLKNEKLNFEESKIKLIENKIELEKTQNKLKNEIHRTKRKVEELKINLKNIDSMFNLDINKLIPIEVKLDGENLDYVLWFEPTLELLTKLPEHLQSKLRSEFEVLQNSESAVCGEAPTENPISDRWNGCNGAIKNLKLYPIPAKDFLNYNFELTENRNLEITFTDINGNKLNVNSVQESFNAGNYNKRLDVSSISPGIYYLTIVSDNNEIVNQRFIKE